MGLHPHGMKLLADLHAVNPDCLVTIITSDRNTRRAVEALRARAFDYLISPELDFAEVDRTYILLQREWQAQLERRQFQDRLAVASAGARMIGVSGPVQHLRQLTLKVAQTSAPVLIIGETGTGKELIARLLHEQGARAAGPFMPVNCSAIPNTLLESELFGHKKGAFTGADRDRPGLLAEANGGTFFFDEIHDLDLPLQGKLLRVLQGEEVRPLGGGPAIKLDVRFIAATNQDLPALVQAKKFREDLFYRLHVVPIRVPPLRERTEDIALLARHFIELYSRREGREPLKMSAAVWRWMNLHTWPGNIRELENLCQRAVALTDGDTFDTDVLALTSTSIRPILHKTTATSEIISTTQDSPAGEYLAAHAALDYQLLQRAIVEHAGNVSRAAKALSISRTTFYARARKFGIRFPSRHPGVRTDANARQSML